MLSPPPTHTRTTPAVEMIASQCERADGIYSTLDQCVEITVLGRDGWRLKLLPPTQANVKYPLPPLIYTPLCPSSSHTQGTISRAGSPFFYQAKCFN